MGRRIGLQQPTRAVASICGQFESCVDGSCTQQCRPGEVACGESCVDPRVSRDHCGASRDCVGSNAGAVCPSGQACNGADRCATSCASGYVPCGGNCAPSGQCSPCGNGGLCSPTDLGGLTCQSLGFSNGGTLVCDPTTCTVVTLLCTPNQPPGGGSGG